MSSKPPRWAGPLVIAGVVLLLFGAIVGCLGVDVRASVAQIMGVE